jgi:hypothetical protein
MKCSNCRVSQEARASILKTANGTTNLWVKPHPLVSLIPDQLSLLSVCAVANLLGEPPASLPISGVCTPILRSCTLSSAAALSSGKLILPGCPWLGKRRIAQISMQIDRIKRKTATRNAKAAIQWMTAYLANGQSRPPKSCPAKPASPARPLHHGSSIIVRVKPEHIYL